MPTISLREYGRLIVSIPYKRHVSPQRVIVAPIRLRALAMNAATERVHFLCFDNGNLPLTFASMDANSSGNSNRTTPSRTNQSGNSKRVTEKIWHVIGFFQTFVSEQ